ncbi:hypothetical protein J8L85_15535 [Maribacter sp. MMG018]|uniref:hypothetical protein n=1 Tax=Maribacter sp. MMG018 TaxID=2822688 RepID=UPI001B384018|nr:hypothetical protein [Maribacter sp. MMG018]MBQ4915867.1 hypothetical protein [Maribacter sp. MMG018]
MDIITIPYHLILPSIIGLLIIGLLIIFKKRFWTKTYCKSLWFSACVFFGLYSIIVGYAAYEDIWLHLELEKYDLNNNLFFDGEECTNEHCTELMKKLVNDTGRNLSVFTGGIKALVIAIPILLVGVATERLTK